MREIMADEIVSTVAELCIRACTLLPGDVDAALEKAGRTERFPKAREILGVLSENADIARNTGIPICQDTGTAVVFVDLGQDVHVQGSLMDAVREGVSQGYVRGYLRKSMVADPLRRMNTGDNTPPMVHVRMVEGDRLTLTVAPKGAGSENMSRLAMLTPGQGVAGVRRFVMETVKLAGANPCPPMILGIGIGGNFETVALLAKEALLEPLDRVHPDPFYANLEQELLAEVNASGIGPQGLGGDTTCLSVKIRALPCHIASLPVAVNVSCHATRHASAVL